MTATRAWSWEIVPGTCVIPVGFVDDKVPPSDLVESRLLDVGHLVRGNQHVPLALLLRRSGLKIVLDDRGTLILKPQTTTAKTANEPITMSSSAGDPRYLLVAYHKVTATTSGAVQELAKHKKYGKKYTESSPTG